MPMRGELSIPAARLRNQRRGATETEKIIAVLTQPELLMIAGVCALGLSMTLFMIYLFPTLGEIMQAFTVYP